MLLNTLFWLLVVPFVIAFILGLIYSAVSNNNLTQKGKV